MHSTSSVYERIYAHAHTVHTMLNLEVIQGGEHKFIEIGEDKLYAVGIFGSVFSEDTPSIGNFTARELETTFEVPVGVTIPKQAQINVFVCIENSAETSEWIQKGVFFVDTRSYNADKSKISIRGFDAAVKFEEDFDSSELSWPASATQVVLSICDSVGVSLHGSWQNKISGFPYYQIPLQTNATKREMLQWIATMYCGNFVIDDYGWLRFISLDTKAEGLINDLLVDEDGNRLVIGGVRIIV